MAAVFPARYQRTYALQCARVKRQSLQGSVPGKRRRHAYDSIGDRVRCCKAGHSPRRQAAKRSRASCNILHSKINLHSDKNEQYETMMLLTFISIALASLTAGAQTTNAAPENAD